MKTPYIIAVSSCIPLLVVEIVLAATGHARPMTFVAIGALSLAIAVNLSFLIVVHRRQP